MQLHALLHEAHERRRVPGVVRGQHGDIRLRRRGFKYHLVGIRQLLPLLQIHVEGQLRPAFPPAGIVVVLGHLVKTELLVVVRPYPFGGVDRAAFERRIDIAAGQRLRHYTEPRQDLPAGVAAGKGNEVVALEEFAHQLEAAAKIHPGVLLARVEPEGQRRVEGERHILADVVVTRGVAALDGALLDGIEHLQSRNDLAAGEYPNLEFSFGDAVHALGQKLGRAVNRVEAFRVARGQTPADGGKPGGAGGRGQARQYPCAGTLDEVTSFHVYFSFFAPRELCARPNRVTSAVLTPMVCRAAWTAAEKIKTG